MSGNHTPTPWRVIEEEEEERGARIISYVQDVVIATVWPFMRAHGELPALDNAEFIVTAVNSYASSQAEIKRLKTALAPFAEAAEVFAREYPAMLDKPGTSCGIRFDALQAARAALSGSKE